MTLCHANHSPHISVKYHSLLIATLSSVKLCLTHISKSFASCAGVIFKAPVPKVGSTYSSAITGMCILRIGTKTVLPINSLYLLSHGCTAIAQSPNIVSGRVVATVRQRDHHFVKYLM